MRGVYQHCGEQHLHRYLAEFDFRYTNRSASGVEDAQRADIALKGIAGKRVTYRRIDGIAAYEGGKAPSQPALAFYSLPGFFGFGLDSFFDLCGLGGLLRIRRSPSSSWGVSDR